MTGTPVLIFLIWAICNFLSLQNGTLSSPTYYLELPPLLTKKLVEFWKNHTSFSNLSTSSNFPTAVSSRVGHQWPAELPIVEVSPLRQPFISILYLSVLSAVSQKKKKMYYTGWHFWGVPVLTQQSTSIYPTAHLLAVSPIACLQPQNFPQVKFETGPHSWKARRD